MHRKMSNCMLYINWSSNYRHANQRLYDTADMMESTFPGKKRHARYLLSHTHVLIHVGCRKVYAFHPMICFLACKQSLYWFNKSIIIHIYIYIYEYTRILCVCVCVCVCVCARARAIGYMHMIKDVSNLGIMLKDVLNIAEFSAFVSSNLLTN